MEGSHEVTIIYNTIKLVTYIGMPEHKKEADGPPW